MVMVPTFRPFPVPEYCMSVSGEKENTIVEIRNAFIVDYFFTDKARYWSLGCN